MSEYEFTVDWFSGQSKEIKNFLDREWFIKHHASKDPTYHKYDVLEVGSYEGRSTVWWCDTFPGSRVVAVDNWEGGAEHRLSNYDMSSVEKRFNKNVEGKSVIKCRGDSALVLAEIGMYGAYPDSEDEAPITAYDLAYIDGSHMADDTLLDAMLAAKLLKPGGYMIFDDYRWSDSRMPGPKFSPKLAIDSFEAVMRNFTPKYKGYIAIYQKDDK